MSADCEIVEDSGEEFDGSFNDSGEEDVNPQDGVDQSDDDSGIEGDLMKQDYKPRKPTGPLPRNSHLMYSNAGGAGILDVESMHFFLREGSARSNYNDTNGFRCAASRLSASLRPPGCEGCRKPYTQRFDDHGHPPLTFKTLQNIRYQVCQRAFAMLRRSHITPEEWNFFCRYTYHRIFGSMDGFVPMSRVPCVLQTCAYTGFLFPDDRKMYVPEIRKRGMFKDKYEYDLLMFETISAIELRHFGFFRGLQGQGGKTIPWKLDFPAVERNEFPDLDALMEDIPLSDIKTTSEFLWFFCQCFTVFLLF